MPITMGVVAGQRYLGQSAPELLQADPLHACEMLPKPRKEPPRRLARPQHRLRPGRAHAASRAGKDDAGAPRTRLICSITSAVAGSARASSRGSLLPRIASPCVATSATQSKSSAPRTRSSVSPPRADAGSHVAQQPGQSLRGRDYQVGRSPIASDALPVEKSAEDPSSVCRGERSKAINFAA
jgi:hypothetical protein